MLTLAAILLFSLSSANVELLYSRQSRIWLLLVKGFVAKFTNTSLALAQWPMDLRSHSCLPALSYFGLGYPLFH
ncbi:uncharacterized protein BDZ99DRAFT_61356 [Mytilinidion resinicola]|uniref:Secreted protein n=1 Tax=Mytilinidion resinicola TaxID=574789 RepID=A0A6A6YHX8_9PEZI|nr:uncharacterized protein BDZ99DRAFT_61356 [Mytilinidion resinicola]KAF2807604.1 hypothetical protein BDZ99DRAFT_61356 [Mytilinidion resinicola]